MADPGVLTGSRPTGHCGLFAVDGRPCDEPETAYGLLASAHGLSYATDAARADVGRARDAGLLRLSVDLWDWDLASLRVLDDSASVRSSGPRQGRTGSI